MTEARRRPLAPFLWILLALCLAAMGAGPGTALADEAQVTYVDGEGRVYLNRGAGAGLKPGSQVQILRGTKPLGTLTLSAVSGARSVADSMPGKWIGRVGDRIDFTGAAPAEPPAKERKMAPLAELAPEARGPAWSKGLMAQARALITYDGLGPAEPWGIRGRAATSWTSKAYGGAPQLSRHEQRVSLWSQGENLGVEGLSLRVRGDVTLRYGAAPYDFMEGQVGVSQFREVAFSYQTRDGLKGVAGRFKPETRMAGVMDGAQVSWGKNQLSLSGFAGVRPSRSTLTPGAGGAAFGVAATLGGDARAEERWRVSMAYLGEGGDGLRHSLSLDSSLGKGGGWMHQQATLALPGATESAGVRLASLQGGRKVGKSAQLRGGIRYVDQSLRAHDINPQTQAWVDALEDQSLARGDLGLTVARGEKRSLRPYAYWSHQRLGAGPDVWVVAAGAAHRRAGILGSGLALEVNGDYGDGTRQQARFGLNVSTSGKRAVRSVIGLQEQWTFAHISGLHTFQHLAHGSLIWGGESDFDLWIRAQGGVDHALYVETALGTWGGGALGVSYEW